MEVVDDGELAGRVSELLECGLKYYAEGNVQLAYHAFKKVLRLEPGSAKAASFVSYIRNHHDVELEDVEELEQNDVPTAVRDIGWNGSEECISAENSSEEDISYESISDESIAALVDELAGEPTRVPMDDRAEAATVREPLQEMISDESPPSPVTNSMSLVELAFGSIELDIAEPALTDSTSPAVGTPFPKIGDSMEDLNEDVRVQFNNEARDTVDFTEISIDLDEEPLAEGDIDLSDFSTHADNSVPRIVEDAVSGGIDLGFSEEEIADLDVGSNPDTSILIQEILRSAPEDDRARALFITEKLIGAATEEVANHTEGVNREAGRLAVEALNYADDNAAAQKLIIEHETILTRALVSSLGELSRVLSLAVPMTEIPFDAIDNRAAFLLTRLDGMSTLEEVLDICGMTKIEALRHLSELYRQGFLKS